ncbi:Ribonuclease H [Abeliophyllum distichum]|uniref:Ribonuclease H n=1 Tax=Abeliophyllum distichum TaxID=126358 RepID=A0ABD1T000_9LAMI
MQTPPTIAPPLVPISLAPFSAPHLNSLAFGPNPLWRQPSWVPKPTLVETPALSLEQRLEDMMGRKIAEAMSKKKVGINMVLEEDPFSLEVMAVPLLRDFEQPKMEKYDGSSDPIDHLRAFVDLMRLQATHDTIMCRSFPPTLRREARDWVATLSPKSIRTFDDFSKTFTTYFTSSKATLGIKDLHMLAVVTAMMNGTRSHPFKMSLSKNPPDTMHELLRRGDKYVDTKEAFFITKGMKDRKEPKSNKRKTRDELRPRKDKGKQKMIHPGGNFNSARKNYARVNRSTSVDKNEKFSQNITFNDEDLEGVTCPHDDALVIVADIADFDVKRVLVDNGSAVDVITWKVFLGLKISPSKIKLFITPHHGFGGATVIPEGTIELPVTLGTYPASVVIMTSFLLVKAPMAYNAIYGRPLLNAARSVVSTYHQVMKFSTSRGVGCVRGDQQVSRRCYLDSILIKNMVMMLDVEQPNGRIKLLELIEDVVIAEGQVLKIGGGIDVEEKYKLVACLCKNIDVFSWGPKTLRRSAT